MVKMTVLFPRGLPITLAESRPRCIRTRYFGQFQSAILHTIRPSQSFCGSILGRWASDTRTRTWHIPGTGIRRLWPFLMISLSPEFSICMEVAIAPRWGTVSAAFDMIRLFFLLPCVPCRTRESARAYLSLSCGEEGDRPGPRSSRRVLQTPKPESATSASLVGSRAVWQSTQSGPSDDRMPRQNEAAQSLDGRRLAFCPQNATIDHSRFVEPCPWRAQLRGNPDWETRAFVDMPATGHSIIFGGFWLGSFGDSHCLTERFFFCGGGGGECAKPDVFQSFHSAFPTVHGYSIVYGYVLLFFPLPTSPSCFGLRAALVVDLDAPKGLTHCGGLT
ncbi:hypothetical protein BDP81DRAFT_131867 [Colletotrichum phormii]|uniref:Uncharacterized protein n=1 Tax=Colletotrichum phormii TaxID=359342 RepID=A0AAJ0EJC7_9PEZI|nr:uncharacterized protein BDP81DRAFT_131867 [Colletotrichum phormii]KAK1641333.1 hypothetical protein BDP81DRAFT_131867 [Colletotrichum phormii]